MNNYRKEERPRDNLRVLSSSVISDTCCNEDGLRQKHDEIVLSAGREQNRYATDLI